MKTGNEKIKELDKAISSMTLIMSAFKYIITQYTIASYIQFSI